MFPGISSDSLIRDKVYQGCPLKHSYSDFKDYLLSVLDVRASDPKRDSRSLEAYRDSVWWAINEAWESYITPDSHLPLQWVSLLTVLIEYRLLPKNVFYFGRGVMEKLDIRRYLDNQPMTSEGREALERDYLHVRKDLDSLDAALLMSDVAEDRWGSSDQ